MSATNLTSFAIALRKLREADGLSYADLAEQSGVSASAIHHYETGYRRPTLEHAARLARALGMSLDTILEKTSK
jgi:transcriptional regulator with XRE-family HTH domain